MTWPEGERPRERLLRLGPQALTDAELLAILLRVGFSGTSAVELGRKLLSEFGSLRAVAEAPMIALRGFKGLQGTEGAKAAQVAAVMEIARRISLPDSREKVSITSTKEAVARLQSELRGLPDEQFRVLYLNRRRNLLDDALLAVGSVDRVRPPIRLIVERALRTNASALILGHNHPSGTAEPSESDRLFTADVLAALRPIGITLLDHVIVAGDDALSFVDVGLMAELHFESLST